MVRRLREPSSTGDEIIVDTSPEKKHKRHRHKKHKRRRMEEDVGSDTSIDVSFEDCIEKPAFKVKLKSRDLPSTSAADLLKCQTARPMLDPRKSIQSSSSNTPPSKASNRKKKGKGRDSATSSEEERWLDAIKSGKLEEVDEELKKIKPKDPKMMTARQRAMYERGTDKEPSLGEVLLALPSGYKEKVMTAEAIQKAALKSQKRKQLPDEKREKDKKKTMDRLLKKQESKNLKNSQKVRPARNLESMIVYKNSSEGITLTMPQGIPLPLQAKTPLEPPQKINCGVMNCKNVKRYNCSKTGVPLCSLECYKKNLLFVA